MSWRHDVIAETWQAICRDAGLSAHLKQKAAEFPPGGYRRISDVYCRGVAGDLSVHLGVVVTSSIHNHAHEWHVANAGVAVAREERRKLREGLRRDSGVHSETRPVGVRKPRTLGPERNQRTGTIGKTEGRLAGGFSPRGSQRRNRPALRVGAAGSVSCSNVGMRLWCLPRWASRSLSRSMRTCSREGASCTWKQVPADRPRA